MSSHSTHFIRSDGDVNISTTCDPFQCSQKDALMFPAVSFVCVFSLLVMMVRCERVLIGYLTGSQRRPGDNIYPRPGLTISGAISYAVDEINFKHAIVDNHTLEFVVAETFGAEEESIRQTATLWTEGNISVYIGPQESCIHEARMAASFNLPMISYVSDVEFAGVE